MQLAWQIYHLKSQLGSIFYIAQLSTIKLYIKQLLKRVKFNLKIVKIMSFFFINYQYQQKKLIYSWFRSASLLSHLSYQLKTFQRIKKCFVYQNVSCWSSNHTQQEQDYFKKKFGNRYLKYKARLSYEQNFQCWITEYKDFDNN